ncbi:hypothetical protein K504DRAFT_505410 [Pleomassaria siparia CBS 279.74]|uniref:Uncharacterized protein n=1 Tax=Pleomassaria siparia CBS 279.74 TaxID=1314801 RepID=A0A6G1K0T8_9PLEO|nr:hypothetical protein K504DRAFT_505410 [Pleomassaria siparia CBS 279.74]
MHPPYHQVYLQQLSLPTQPTSHPTTTFKEDNTSPEIPHNRIAEVKTDILSDSVDTNCTPRGTSDGGSKNTTSRASTNGYSETVGGVPFAIP